MNLTSLSVALGAAVPQATDPALATTVRQAVAEPPPKPRERRPISPAQRAAAHRRLDQAERAPAPADLAQAIDALPDDVLARMVAFIPGGTAHSLSQWRAEFGDWVARQTKAPKSWRHAWPQFVAERQDLPPSAAGATKPEPAPVKPSTQASPRRPAWLARV